MNTPLETLADALETLKPKLDDDGDYFIYGRYGEIYDDGDSWGVLVDSISDIKPYKKEFSKFMELREEFDTGEETWILKELPTPEQAKVLRHWLGLPKRINLRRKSSSGFEQFVSIYDAAKACQIDTYGFQISEEELLKYLMINTYVGKLGDYYIVRVYDNRCGPIRGRKNLHDGPEFLTAPNTKRKYWTSERKEMLEKMKKRIKGEQP